MESIKSEVFKSEYNIVKWAKEKGHTHFLDTIEAEDILEREFQYYVDKVERFFNYDLTASNLDEMKKFDIIYLTEASKKIVFPFIIVDDKLKLLIDEKVKEKIVNAINFKYAFELTKRGRIANERVSGLEQTAKTNEQLS